MWQQNCSLLGPLQNIKEGLCKHSVLGNSLKNFNKVLTLLQLTSQRNQLDHNMIWQNILADRGDDNNVSNFL